MNKPLASKTPLLTPCPICSKPIGTILFWQMGPLYLKLDGCEQGHIALDSSFLELKQKSKLIVPTKQPDDNPQ